MFEDNSDTFANCVNRLAAYDEPGCQGRMSFVFAEIGDKVVVVVVIMMMMTHVLHQAV